MGTKDAFKKLVWEAMIKPIPKVIAYYEVAIVGSLWLLLEVGMIGAMIEEKKKK